MSLSGVFRDEMVFFYRYKRLTVVKNIYFYIFCVVKTSVVAICRGGAQGVAPRKTVNVAGV